MLEGRGRSGDIDAVVRSAQSGGRKVLETNELDWTAGQHMAVRLKQGFGKSWHQKRLYYLLRMEISGTSAQSY